ncbi:hypothetical protein GC197_06275 [bacterium]|nr:hypothetical protein [bacterium]
MPDLIQGRPVEVVVSNDVYNVPSEKEQTLGESWNDLGDSSFRSIMISADEHDEMLDGNSAPLVYGHVTTSDSTNAFATSDFERL